MKLNFTSKANYDEWFEHEDKINLNNSFAVLLIHTPSYVRKTF